MSFVFEVRVEFEFREKTFNPAFIETTEIKRKLNR